MYGCLSGYRQFNIEELLERVYCALQKRTGGFDSHTPLLVALLAQMDR